MLSFIIQFIQTFQFSLQDWIRAAIQSFVHCNISIGASVTDLMHRTQCCVFKPHKNWATSLRARVTNCLQSFFITQLWAPHKKPRNSSRKESDLVWLSIDNSWLQNATIWQQNFYSRFGMLGFTINIWWGLFTSIFGECLDMRKF